MINWSHSSRVCGLKFCSYRPATERTRVTLFTGVWIEIGAGGEDKVVVLSHSSRVCGLKSQYLANYPQQCTVTLFTGVWIEIGLLKY